MGNGTISLVLVDDHVLFREGLVSLFRAQPDFQVVGEAGSVQEAIDLSYRLHPEMILMDYLLPDGSGVDATLVILKDNPLTKVVFLSSYEGDENLFLALRSGAYGYLLKSLPAAKLLAALRALEEGQAAISRRMMTRILEEFVHLDLRKGQADSKILPLTAREVEIVCEIADGCSNQEIADRLFISESTVKNHVHHALKKMGLKSRQGLAQYAASYGFRKF